MHQVSFQHSRLLRILRFFFTTSGLFLLLEGCIFLLFNPDHLLGEGDILQHFFTFIFLLTHHLFLVLILLSQFSLLFLTAWFIVKPLAIFAYLHSIQKVQSESNTLYFPLAALPLITSQASHQTPSNPGSNNQSPRVSILDLVQHQGFHQLLLGAPGSGKTTVLKVYQYMLSRRYWAILFGREKLPVYIPMNYYNLYLRDHVFPTNTVDGPADTIPLLKYLTTNGNVLPGLQILRPYFKRMVEQGRILFLCDGLNEIDNRYLPVLCKELTQIIHQYAKNRIMMTCREVDYDELPLLRQWIGTNSVDQLRIYPLAYEQVENFVDEYVRHRQAEKKFTSPKEELITFINDSSLRTQCTNPMMLSTLLNLINAQDREKSQQIDTRGRLMHEFVLQLIRREQQKWGKAAPDEQSVLLLLGEIACAARWESERNAIQLTTSTRRTKGHTYYLELAETLTYWLYEHRAQEPFTADEVAELPHESFDEETLAQLIRFAAQTELISISENNELCFRHEMVAEYFVAYYFFVVDRSIPSLLPLNQKLFEDVSRWSEAVILWAGLVEDSTILATRFAAFGQQHTPYLLEALTFSLNCMGVLWKPVYVQSQRPALPSNVEEAVTRAVQDVDARKKLAGLFDNCAQKGGKEIYLSLFPLLPFAGMEDLLGQLDREVVPELLFQHLEDIVENDRYNSHIKYLMRVLGEYKNAAVNRATQLSRSPEGCQRLRAAAITILGFTHEPGALEPLIEGLSDDDGEISTRAAKAIIRLGPEHALSRILQLHPDSTAYGLPYKKLLLQILEAFLETKITPLQRQRILKALCSTLSSHYETPLQQQAGEILKQQYLAPAGSPQIVLEVLLEYLSTADMALKKNIQQILAELGQRPTPGLLDHLKKASSIVKIRIIEVFEHTRDMKAMPHLLYLMEDLELQEHAAQALRIYAPESIPRLVHLVLTSNNKQVAEKSARTLQMIREEVVKHILPALSPIVPGRTLLLVQVLAEIRDPQAIPALIAILETSPTEKPLVEKIIQALSQYRNKQVVPPLLKILEEPDTKFSEEAINGLVQVGNVALEEIITTLAKEHEPRVVLHIQRVLYHMQPFPGEQLIAHLPQSNALQTKHLLDVFIMQQEEGAKALVEHLHSSNPQVQSAVYQTLKDIGPKNVSALLTLLKRPLSQEEMAWVTELLAENRSEAIPRLIEMLNDDKGRERARDALLRFGPAVIPFVVPGLDAQNSTARDYSRSVIVKLVRQQPECLSQVVQLLKGSLPEQAYETLLEVFTHELAHNSIPMLLAGLEDADLVRNIAEVLKHLAQGYPQLRSEIANGLRAALGKESQHRGAKHTLVELGAFAVPIVGEMITDADPSLAQTAQSILREIGEAALPFIWVAYNNASDTALRAAALHILHGISTEKIKSAFIELLAEDSPETIAMGLGLLLERIHGEAAIPGADKEIIPALLAHIQTHNDERIALRALAWLLVVDSNKVKRHIKQALQDYPYHHERLTRMLLLIGKDAESVLLEILHQPTTGGNSKLKGEAASTLGMLTPHQDVSRYALALSTYGYGSAKSISDKDELSIALHALGGLLAGNHWQISSLEDLGKRMHDGSPAHELSDTLLGKLVSPTLAKLRQELLKEQTERNTEKDALEELNKDLNEKMKKLLMSNKQTREENQTLQEQNEDLQTRYDELQTTYASSQTRINNLERQLRHFGIYVP